MALLTAFLTYVARFVIMIAVVVVAYLCGKKVKDVKTKNKPSSN